MPNPYCTYLLCAGSKMDKQRRLRLAQILKSKGGASSQGVGDSTPPTSATAPASPNSCPQHLPTPSTSPTQLSPDQPPNSPPPIATMPLALVETATSSTPLNKGKRVMVVPSDDEDSAEGQVFKRQRTTQHAPQTATSATSSSHGAESLRENPPSANSTAQPMALEGGLSPSPLLFHHLPQNSPSQCKIR